MRRSPRNLKIACDHRGLTHFGGVFFFHEFHQLLQPRHSSAEMLNRAETPVMRLLADSQAFDNFLFVACGASSSQTPGVD